MKVRITLALIASLISFSGYAATDEQRFKACQAKLIKANESGALQDIGWTPPSEPKVLVGEIFFKLPIDVKEGFVQTINCFLSAAQVGMCVDFDVRSGLTGKPVGRFAKCHFEMN